MSIHAGVSSVILSPDWGISAQSSASFQLRGAGLRFSLTHRHTISGGASNTEIPARKRMFLTSLGPFPHPCCSQLKVSMRGCSIFCPILMLGLLDDATLSSALSLFWLLISELGLERRFAEWPAGCLLLPLPSLLLHTTWSSSGSPQSRAL